MYKEQNLRIYYIGLNENSNIKNYKHNIIRTLIKITALESV